MPDNMFVLREKGRKVTVTTYHEYEDCNRAITGPDVVRMPVGNHEIDILGLRECILCRNRRTGGPALEALTIILGDRDDAWKTYNALKERGFYIARRGAGTLRIEAS